MTNRDISKCLTLSDKCLLLGNKGRKLAVCNMPLHSQWSKSEPPQWRGEVVTSRCHGSKMSGSEQTVVHGTKKKETKKLTWIPFLRMIELRNKTVAHTFLPSFDKANGRPCQESLLRPRSWFCHHGNVMSQFTSLWGCLLAACSSPTSTLPTWRHGRSSLGFFDPVIPTVILNIPFNGQICWTEYSYSRPNDKTSIS